MDIKSIITPKQEANIFVYLFYFLNIDYFHKWLVSSKLRHLVKQQGQRPHFVGPDVLVHSSIKKIFTCITEPICTYVNI